MTIDQDKEDLDRAIELLVKTKDKLDADYYRGWSELEFEIKKFLKEIKENDSRKSKD